MWTQQVTAAQQQVLVPSFRGSAASFALARMRPDLVAGSLGRAHFAQRKAAVICRHCPVILECGADALDNRVEFGVWGGMTERQRRALLKQHPEVVSWAEFFAAQRKHRSAV